MRKFDTETLLIAYQLEQLLYDFAAEVDTSGDNVGLYYSEDAVFRTPGANFEGRAAIEAYYQARNANVVKHQKDGKRTGRHTFLNVRVHVHDADRATLRFTNVNYAGEGPPPVPGLKGPSAVADCRMEARRQADGHWQFTEFVPVQALVGEDDFMKLMLSMQAK